MRENPSVSEIFSNVVPNAVASPENPLMLGQTATIGTDLFSPPVTAGQTYQFTVVAGFSD